MTFKLDGRLADDTIYLTELSLCRVLLMNDRRYPWLILVPRYNGLKEIHDLSEKDQSNLMSEITTTTGIIEKLFTPDKINVAALGNSVSQLHIHIIARFKEDDAWPGPVWGKGSSQNYSDDEEKGLADQLVNSLTT